MKLKALFNNDDIEKYNGNLELDIRGISYNSSNVDRDFLFVAIKGFKNDGHNFIENAIEKGAIAVAVENEEYFQKLKNRVVVIKTPDNRRFLSKVSSNFYNNPSLKLDVIGITGTNGKTTTSYLLYHIFKSNGFDAGLTGTINYKIKDKEYPSEVTTPESLEFQKILNEMVFAGVKYVASEISSHSLKLHRVDDCHFKVSIFTNLTEDHFDFHKNFEDYFESKSKLFELLKFSKKSEKFGVINIDDEWGKKLFNRFRNEIEIFTYSINSKEANFTAGEIKLSENGSEFLILKNYGKKENYFIKTGLIGYFNIYNILAAFTTGYNLGLSTDGIIKAINNFIPPSGRLEKIDAGDFKIFIDYAHTEDALKNVLSTLRPICNGRIITIFGCGGDRDRNKRPLMGKVASELSDIVIVTSDNPRTENPEQIIDEIEKGIDNRSKNYYRITDRYEAIKKGISLAKKNDFVLIAGKGHENYQIIGNKKIYFNDKEVAIEIIKQVDDIQRMSKFKFKNAN